MKKIGGKDDCCSIYRTGEAASSGFIATSFYLYCLITYAEQSDFFSKIGGQGFDDYIFLFTLKKVDSWEVCGRQ